MAPINPPVQKQEILYTYTDEAPALATHSLLPIVRAFTQSCCTLKLVDISLAGRILAAFPEMLQEEERVNDELGILGDLVKKSSTLVCKLPNISASIPQLEAAIFELQSQGYNVPSYPKKTESAQDESVKAKYTRILGSAVNPVLREGNSDRRAAQPVKAYAQKHPHKNKAWSPDSKSRVAHMTEGDFYSSEVSCVVKTATKVRIEFMPLTATKDSIVLKACITLQPDEVIDAAVMNIEKLRAFYLKEIQDAKKNGTLFSLHLKATMMKVSDPILFGHCVTTYYEAVLERHKDALAKIGFDPRSGLGDILSKLSKLEDETQRLAITQDLEGCLREFPMAMVDSDRGITNLHVPSNIIIDASVPAAIRDGGKMWNPQGELQDTTFCIPDRSYAKCYQTVFDDCIKNGALDPTSIGAVSNVGLMAQKAEEYGSHDKTFELSDDGEVRVVDIATGNILLSRSVKKGDIFRMCQTKDLPIRDWVNLAISRARATGAPAIFWLDEHRAHDRVLTAKVHAYLKEYDTKNLDISIASPEIAMQRTLARSRQGLDTISVTGNVLRDYLTDLFPILELGTSAKMLSIVPLLAGGGLFETGAGGSAPRHVQQLLSENHLRWDSLGEYLAIAVALEDLAYKTRDQSIKLIADSLNTAVSSILDNDKSPKRKSGQLDTRGSHYFLARYWARALATQSQDSMLAQKYILVAEALESKEAQILAELSAGAGEPIDLGGYYKMDFTKTDAAMRPSATLNAIIDSVLS